MWIVATYIEYNIPKTGLTPTIKIYRLSDKNLVVNGDNMDELGDGMYTYNFNSYDSDEDYMTVCDGGSSLISRYCYPLSFFKDYTTDLTFLKDIAGGRWKIINNQMILYKKDNITEVAKFNLKKLGIPSEDMPDERVRV